MFSFLHLVLIKSFYRFSEDLLTYEIGDIDVHDEGDDDLDAVEDELLMSDDGNFICIRQFHSC